jgi:hypothetical protein
MNMDKADRDNGGKVELSYMLDFPHALVGACSVLEYGAGKYQKHNWKKGLPSDQIIDSMLRHLLEFKNGEQFDSESGLLHVHHILTNALFLSELYGRTHAETRTAA